MRICRTTYPMPIECLSDYPFHSCKPSGLCPSVDLPKIAKPGSWSASCPACLQSAHPHCFSSHCMWWPSTCCYSWTVGGKPLLSGNPFDVAITALTPKSLLSPQPMSIGHDHMMGGLSVVGYHIITFQFWVSDFIRQWVVTQRALGLYCRLIRSILSVFSRWVRCVKQWWVYDALQPLIYYPLCMSVLSIALLQVPGPEFVQLMHFPALGLWLLCLQSCLFPELPLTLLVGRRGTMGREDLIDLNFSDT